MSTIPMPVQNLKHLRTLIEKEMVAHGPYCYLNHLDVSKVTNMNSLFSMAAFNGNISQWDVSNVESMVEMFYNSSFNGDISKWNTAKVERFGEMFLNGAFHGDISAWCFNSTTPHYMSCMFSDSQITQLREPNVYCWACALSVPEKFTLPGQWKVHFDNVAPALLGLGLPILDTATLVHQAWMERSVQPDVWSLPNLG